MIDSGHLLFILEAVMERIQAEDLTQQLPAYNLSKTQYRAIRFLRHNGGSELFRLAEALEISAPAATKLADRLEKGGFVQRVPCQADKRRVDLVLTEQAEDCLDALERRTGAALAKVFAELTADQQQQLLTGAEAFLRAALKYLPAEKLCQYCGGLHTSDCPLSQGEEK
ncbi:MAG: MarR family winged helix-turn-helix transcriptional regulator [Bacillota bacterium]|jgi:MarR family 2-MHQ and catechol resistance regulon transcriptional repressor